MKEQTTQAPIRNGLPAWRAGFEASGGDAMATRTRTTQHHFRAQLVNGDASELRYPKDVNRRNPVVPPLSDGVGADFLTHRIRQLTGQRVRSAGYLNRLCGGVADVRRVHSGDFRNLIPIVKSFYPWNTQRGNRDNR